MTETETEPKSTLLEIFELESIETLDDEDHIVCGGCFPDFDPGRIVTALCGAKMRDCPVAEGDQYLTDVECKECIKLDKVRPCPQCGMF